MIEVDNAPKYAVMDEDNDLVWAANHYAFYKTIGHAEAKIERGNYRGAIKWRVVKVVYEELDSD